MKTLRYLVNKIMILSLVVAPSILIVTALSPQHCYAASALATARTHFEDGDLKRTKAALEKLLTPTPRVSGADLEEARKLYGVTLFLMGKRKDAEDAFRAVLSSNPQARLKDSDILDPAMPDLFEKVRASVEKSKTKNSNATLPKAPANAALLVLSCSVPKAAVFVNDLFVGTCAAPITLEAGNHEVSITAEGFVDSKHSITLKLGQTKKLEIKLEKYNDSSAESTNEVFATKPTAENSAEAAAYTAPLPVPQNGGLDVIQLPQLQDGQDPQVFMQPAPYTNSSQRTIIPKRSMGVAFLPFGAGQFQNGQAIKGAVFLVAEAAGTGTFVYAYFKEKDFSNRESQFEANDAAAYRKKLKLLANSALAFTGLSYFIGVLDALVNIDAPAIASKSIAKPTLAFSPTGEAHIGFSIQY